MRWAGLRATLRPAALMTCGIVVALCPQAAVLSSAQVSTPSQDRPSPTAAWAQLHYRVSPTAFDLDLAFRIQVLSDRSALTLGYAGPTQASIEVRATSVPIRRATIQSWPVQRPAAMRDGFRPHFRQQALLMELGVQQPAGTILHVASRVHSTDREALLYGYYESERSVCGAPGEEPRVKITFDARRMPFVSTNLKAEDGEEPGLYTPDCGARFPQHFFYSVFRTQAEFLAGYRRLLEQAASAAADDPDLIRRLTHTMNLSEIASAPPERRLSVVIETLKNALVYKDNFPGQNGILPRPLKEVVNTGFADCKEMTSLVMLLGRMAGLEFDPVLLNSASKELPDSPFPVLLSANHVIAVERRTGTFLDMAVHASVEKIEPLTGHQALVIRPGGSVERVVTR